MRKGLKGKSRKLAIGGPNGLQNDQYKEYSRKNGQQCKIIEETQKRIYKGNQRKSQGRASPFSLLWLGSYEMGAIPWSKEGQETKS